MWVPLTVKGLAQAQAAGEALAGRPITAVWSSDQARALHSAQIIARRVGAPLRECPGLREQGLGELEGRSYDDLRAEAVPEGRHISEVRWGGGESVADVHARLLLLVDELSALGEDDDVVFVSHGDTLRVLLAVLAGRGHRDVDWGEAFGNGEIRTVSWQRPAG